MHDPPYKPETGSRFRLELKSHAVVVSKCWNFPGSRERPFGAAPDDSSRSPGPSLSPTATQCTRQTASHQGNPGCHRTPETKADRNTRPRDWAFGLVLAFGCDLTGCPGFKSGGVLKASETRLSTPMQLIQRSPDERSLLSGSWLMPRIGRFSLV